MSKGLGQKIGIKFTEDLVEDVTGWVPEPVTHGDYFRPIGVATGSSQYSSYAPSNAFDGSTSSYWYTRTAGDQWVQIELAEPTWIYGFRWYVGDSYRPNGFDFQGSNDGEIWEGILTGNSPGATGWHEFPTDSPKQYKYYRWTVISRYASYLYVYEIELLGAVGNERAFTVTGKEYQYVNGPLIDKEYRVDKVEKKGINDLLRTDVNGVAEFIIDTNIVGIDYSELEWSIAAQGYISKTGIENDLTEEVLIEVVLERNQLPNIEGLVLHLDATDHVNIINEPTIPQTIGGLMLNLNLDEWSDL